MPTVEVAPRGPRPPIRVRPVPRCDPPFDDELEPHIWAGSAHQLALDWPSRTAPQRPARPADLPVGRAPSTAPTGPGLGRPTGSALRQPIGGRTGSPARPTPEMAAALRGDPITGAPPASSATRPVAAGAPADATLPVAAGVPGGAVRPVTAGASGDAKLAVRRFVQMCVEVLNGYRPAAHLRRLALPKEAAGVVAQAVAGTGRVAELRQDGRLGHRRERRPTPVGVIRLRLCEPRSGAVEAAVLLVTGERTWAMALRLELHQENWCATTLRLV